MSAIRVTAYISYWCCLTVPTILADSGIFDKISRLELWMHCTAIDLQHSGDGRFRQLWVWRVQDVWWNLWHMEKQYRRLLPKISFKSIALPAGTIFRWLECFWCDDVPKLINTASWLISSTKGLNLPAPEGFNDCLAACSQLLDMMMCWTTRLVAFYFAGVSGEDNFSSASMVT